ncbi:unnamed protein product [Amoebophrya sp. A120]|nr:unnamed protein product [Amoebophrya sp. A120]|eukprot:GSA120T00021543001.1
MATVADDAGSISTLPSGWEESQLWHMSSWTTNDAVYNEVALPLIFNCVIDHRIVQRLREIKQLALVEYVYKDATHSRFAHSIGVGYLMCAFLREFDQEQFTALVKFNRVKEGKIKDPWVLAVRENLRLNDKDRICLIVAALCHDLGHAPFSHMFEVFRRENGDDPTWSHETASKLLVQAVWEDVKDVMKEEYWKFCEDHEPLIPVLDWNEKDLLYIQELIDVPGKKELQEALRTGRLHEEWGKHIQSRPIEYAWTFELLSNWRGGLDVDRLDYFLRDTYHAKVSCPICWNRVKSSIRVVAHQEAACPGSTSGTRSEGDEEGEENNHSENYVEQRIDTNKNPNASTTTAAKMKAKLTPRQIEQKARERRRDTYVLTAAFPSKDRDSAVFDFRSRVYQSMYLHPVVVRMERCKLREMQLLKTHSKAAFQKLLRFSDLTEENFSVDNYLRLTDSFVKEMIADDDEASKFHDQVVQKRAKETLIDVGSYVWEPRGSVNSSTFAGSAFGSQIFQSKARKEEVKRELHDFLVTNLPNIDWNAWIESLRGTSRSVRFNRADYKLSPSAEKILRDHMTESLQEGSLSCLYVNDEVFHNGNGERDPRLYLAWYDKKVEPAFEPNSSGDGGGQPHVKNQIRLLWFCPPKAPEFGETEREVVVRRMQALLAQYQAKPFGWRSVPSVSQQDPLDGAQDHPQAVLENSVSRNGLPSTQDGPEMQLPRNTSQDSLDHPRSSNARGSRVLQPSDRAAGESLRAWQEQSGASSPVGGARKRSNAEESHGGDRSPKVARR